MTEHYIKAEFVEARNKYFAKPSTTSFQIFYSRYCDMEDVMQEELKGIYAFCVLHWAIKLYRLTIHEAYKRDFNSVATIIDKEKIILQMKFNIWLSMCSYEQILQLKQYFYEQS